METPESVASQTEAVESRCRDIVRCIEMNKGTAVIPSEDVTDVWDKFKLWAGNIGARQTPESAASLESRLKGARRILSQVVGLLNDIQDALDDLFEIVSGNQDNRRIVLGPQSVNEHPKSSQSSDCNNVDGKELEKDEAHDIIGLLSDCVGSLLKITVLIRKATPRDRFAKALIGHDPFMDAFDIAHVAEKYPKLAEPKSQWLCERLGRAITKRRQFLRYSRDHSRRIAGNEDIGSVAFQRAHNPADQDGIISAAKVRSATSSTASKMRTTLSAGSYAARTLASTKASTLDIAELQRVEYIEAEDEDTKSYVSAGSSFQLGNTESTLHLPTLEEVSQGSEVFECPLCFGIQTISKESSWRRHAFQDLKAYVCTGEGDCDTKLFGDSRAWLDHELQCHRQQWACILCSQGPFKSKKVLEDHLTRTHDGIIVGGDQLDAFVSAGLRAVNAIPAGDCPFCNEWVESLKSTTSMPNSTIPEDVIMTIDPKQYRRHVSHHLEQLALFALPRHADGDDNDNASEGANLGRSTVNQPSGWTPSVSENEWETDEEWVPDPPLHIAAARGDLEEVERLVNDGADLHLRGETWGGVLDAALSFPGASRPALLHFLRLRLADYKPQLAGELPSATPTGGQKSSERTLSKPAPHRQPNDTGHNGESGSSMTVEKVNKMTKRLYEALSTAAALVEEARVSTDSINEVIHNKHLIKILQMENLNKRLLIYLKDFEKDWNSSHNERSVVEASVQAIQASSERLTSKIERLKRENDNMIRRKIRESMSDDTVSGGLGETSSVITHGSESEPENLGERHNPKPEASKQPSPFKSFGKLRSSSVSITPGSRKPYSEDDDFGHRTRPPIEPSAHCNAYDDNDISDTITPASYTQMQPANTVPSSDGSYEVTGDYIPHSLPRTPESSRFDPRRSTEENRATAKEIDEVSGVADKGKQIEESEKGNV